LFRYHELNKIIRQKNGFYFTGHHTQDYCESVLLHITRGAGKGAFNTLPPLTKDRFLPLVFLPDPELNLLYEKISDFFPIFEDESNDDITFKRNRIRKQITPILKKEKMNFYRFYWNFHHWESENLEAKFDQRFEIQTNVISVENQNVSEFMNPFETQIPKTKSPYYFRIPNQTWDSLDPSSQKQLLDFYLSLLGHPPLYRSQFLEFLRQSSSKANVETKSVIILKILEGDIHLLSKESKLLLAPIINKIDHKISVNWNENHIEIENINNEWEIRPAKPGEKINFPYGKKEISEIYREKQIPEIFRRYIPVVYEKNLPIQILFSMFDPSLPNYPKR